MTKQKDILGNIPEIGDIIVFNPPRYKGLVYKRCVGFSKAGLPKVVSDDDENFITPPTTTPKTGFVTIKQ